MPTYISHNHLSNDFGTAPTLDNKIEVFRDRVQGWQIDIAKHIETHPHGGYGILYVLSNYYEMIAQYWKGVSSDGRSKKMFVFGFKLVYDATALTKQQIESIYSSLRCGLYHSGYTKRGLVISGDFQQAFDVCEVQASDGTKYELIQINPHIMLKDIDTHFRNYILTLQDLTNTERRKNFETIFDA